MQYFTDLFFVDGLHLQLIRAKICTLLDFVLYNLREQILLFFFTFHSCFRRVFYNSTQHATLFCCSKARARE